MARGYKKFIEIEKPKYQKLKTLLKKIKFLKQKTLEDETGQFFNIVTLASNKIDAICDNNFVLTSDIKSKKWDILADYLEYLLTKYYDWKEPPHNKCTESDNYDKINVLRSHISDEIFIKILKEQKRVLERYINLYAGRINNDQEI